jgi:hypothetical protein
VSGNHAADARKGSIAKAAGARKRLIRTVCYPLAAQPGAR